MEIFYDPAFLITAVIAVALAGLSKGGFAGVATLSTPLLALTISPLHAAAIMLPILLLQDAFSLVAYRRHIDWTNILILLPSAVIGIVIGYFQAEYLPEEWASGMIGLISIVFGLRSLFSKAVANAPAKKAEVGPGIFWGMVGGFTSMILHAGSPPFQIYVMPQRLSRDLYVGTSVFFFAAVNWIKVPPYLMLGELNWETLKISLALFPLAGLSTLAGIWLVRRFSTEDFYKVINVLLVLVGLKLLWPAVTFLL
ncbi:sulfite exporter TauE/SafE family protein [Rhizobium sp. L1K21]|uniref:sulfite exporter TauE/SafE family protein n=1 Tax=Rhizobium sp. L1K21 TaxID=2954933 RepID=UPI0020926A73|nr:sulfite exporter TauE/SafE family protein [Rhizobium sp. L1K21]MCO6185307.1 sulfite exporter TauE/SafE family protein [Rhizobium sp. L1K21]